MRHLPRRDRELPVWLIGATIASGFVACLVLERRYPLRDGRRERKLTRDARNLAVAGLGLAVTQLAERPLTNRVTHWVRHRRVGLLPWLNLPGPLDTLLGAVLLDATLYYWHYLTHRVPLLWKFHRVHHADLDMDATTGLRFHAGELLISSVFRVAQVTLFGVSRRALSIWNTLLLVEVMFHHADVALPPPVERWVSWLIVTPRLHGIHHSTAPDEMNSNWSSGLSVWDHLHGTYRNAARRADAAIDIGVSELRRPDDVSLPKLLALPFDKGLPPMPKE